MLPPRSVVFRPLAMALGLAALALGTGFHASASHAAGQRRPSFVFILADDLDVELGSMAALPHVQQLIADRGATFSRYFVPISLCCPSRASILRGQYPHNHGIFSNFAPDGGFLRFQALGLERATLATALQAAGYRTALLGKYLNGYPDGKDPEHVPPGWDEWASPQGNDAYGELGYVLNENGTAVRYGTAPEDYLTDVLAAKASDFIRRTGATGQPFLLYVATYAPHKPATPAARHQALFPDAQVPRTKAFDEADLSGKPAIIRQLPLLSAAEIAATDALYRRRLQSLQAVDELVLRLVRTLRSTGQLDDTYVIFTSDNGFHMGQHRLRSGKYTAYEEDVHVPLVLRGPGVQAGTTIPQLAVSVDLAPTFADLAGAHLAVAADGRSLAPLWSASPPAAGAWRRAVLIEQRPFKLPAAAPSTEGAAGTLEPPDPGDATLDVSHVAYAGLRSDRYKYVEYATGERELYDLDADPHELRNLAARASSSFLRQAAAVVARLHACAGAGCRSAEAVQLPAP